MKRKRIARTAGLGLLGAGLGLLFLFPIYILVLNAFKTQKGIFIDVLGFPKGDFFTLDNFAKAFKALDYTASFTNSLLVTVAGVLLVLLTSTMAAWVLARYKTRTSKTVFTFFAASMLIPFQCVMLPLVMLGSRLGLMNPPGLVLMYMGFGSSMAIVMLHGFVKNIPEELEEAATIDGCNALQLFFIIVVPLMKTILITLAVLDVMWIWNDYLLPSLVINKPGWQTLPLKTYLFFGEFAKKWDMASAGLLMCIIPIIIFYLFCQKYIVKGVTDGAIK